MTDFASLLRHIHAQDSNHKPPDYVPSLPGFPLPQMYRGQASAYEQLKQYKSALIRSHTGSGKTALFLSQTPGIPTIVIEPRKFLQKQVASYRGDVILFGRSEYSCHYAPSAASSPCTRKIRCDRTDYQKKCPTRHTDCLKKPCMIFKESKEWLRYPCSSCKYLDAVSMANQTLRHGGTIILNFGNFWQFIRDADLIVIDEADLFFKEISSPEIMRSCNDPSMEIPKMISNEITSTETQMQTCSIGQYYALRNRLYRLEFLAGCAELCFTYKKRGRDKRENVYVEVNPANTNLLKEHIFGEKKVLIITATPGEFEIPSVDYTIHQRCGIYYAPQGKLTARSLQQQPFLLNNAAGFITTTAAVFDGLYDSKKFVVHCGNIGYHATNIKAMINELENKGKPPMDQKDYTVLHEAGNLMGTIEKFIDGDKRYLLVASAEYGADFTWCNCQFILKFPYASLDDRLKALERKLGKEGFNRFYTMDAVNRLIQQAGRVGRGWDSFGCTFILDSKFGEIYSQYKGSFPGWFKERLCTEVF